MEIQQQADQDERRLRQVREELLLNPREDRLNECLAELREMQPSLAEQTSTVLGRLFEESSDELARDIGRTLVTIGTTRSHNEIIRLVERVPVARVALVVDLISQLPDDPSWTALLRLSSVSDPRIAGRAKGLLVGLHRQRLLQHALQVAETRDVIAANDVLDAITLTSGADVDTGLMQFVSFQGDPSQFPYERNPRARALRLLFGKQFTDVRDSVVEICSSATRPLDERVAAAALLLGTEDEAVANTLLWNELPQRQEEGIPGGAAIISMLYGSDRAQDGVRLFNTHFSNGNWGYPFAGEPDPLFLMDELRIQPLIDDLEFYYPYVHYTSARHRANRLTMARHPEAGVTAMNDSEAREAFFGPIRRAEFLVLSPRREDRVQGIDLWLATMNDIHNRREVRDPSLVSTVAKDIRSLPEDVRRADDIAALIQSPIDLVWQSACLALMGTKHQERALAAAFSQARLGTVGWDYYFTLLESVGKTVEIATNLVSLAQDSEGSPTEDLPMVIAKFIKYVYDETDRVLLIREYVSRADSVSAPAEWGRNRSQGASVFPEVRKLIDAVAPDDGKRWLSSIGELSSGSGEYGALFMGWWTIRDFNR
jgi:hypothetical protein